MYVPSAHMAVSTQGKLDVPTTPYNVDFKIWENPRPKANEEAPKRVARTTPQTTTEAQIKKVSSKNADENSNPHKECAAGRTVALNEAVALLHKITKHKYWSGLKKRNNGFSPLVILDIFGSPRTAKIFHEFTLHIRRELITGKDYHRYCRCFAMIPNGSLNGKVPKNLYKTFCNTPDCNHVDPDVVLMNDTQYFLTLEYIHQCLTIAVNKPTVKRLYAGARFAISVLKVFNPEYNSDIIRIPDGKHDIDQGFWYRCRDGNICYVPNINAGELETCYVHPDILSGLFNNDAVSFKVSGKKMIFHKVYSIPHGKSHITAVVLCYFAGTEGMPTVVDTPNTLYKTSTWSETGISGIDTTDPRRDIANTAAALAPHDMFQREMAGYYASRDVKISLVNAVPALNSTMEKGTLYHKHTCRGCYQPYIHNHSGGNKSHNHENDYVCSNPWCKYYHHLLCTVDNHLHPHVCPNPTKHADIANTAYLSNLNANSIGMLPEGSIQHYADYLLTRGSIVVDGVDRKSTRLNSSHLKLSRMPSSA